MTESLVISIDGMGGDHGAPMTIGGVAEFAKSHPQAKFLIHGDEKQLTDLVATHPVLKGRVKICHADKVIEMDDKPAQAVRRGKGSSMWNAIESVKNGDANACVSAGNTGALMAMAKLILRTMNGVHRPALCASWPTVSGICCVLDLGADITADAEQLSEFAIMGTAFARAVHHKESPSVGLLNIGSEDMKGNDTLRNAAELISKSNLNFDFKGFVEGDDISMGTTDVVVTDGFTGNIALKSAEGAAKLMGHFLSTSLKSSLFGLLGGLIATPALKMVKHHMDPRQVNGAVFLGLKGMVIKSHGGTDALGFARAIDVAAEMGAFDFAHEIEKDMKRLSATVSEFGDQLDPTEAAE